MEILTSFQEKFVRRTNGEAPEPNLRVLTQSELVEELTTTKYSSLIDKMLEERRISGSRSTRYMKLKEQLPAIAFGGTFKDNYREGCRIETTSGLAFCDVDLDKSPDITKEDLQAVFDMFKEFRSCFYVGYSSSGEGIHALIRIPSYHNVCKTALETQDRYKAAFGALYQFIATNSKQILGGKSVLLDTAVNQVSSIKFVGDARLPYHVNEDAIVFPVEFKEARKYDLVQDDRDASFENANRFSRTLIYEGMFMWTEKGSVRTLYNGIVGSRHDWIVGYCYKLVRKYNLTIDQYKLIVEDVITHPESAKHPVKPAYEVYNILNGMIRYSESWYLSDGTFAGAFPKTTASIEAISEAAEVYQEDLFSTSAVSETKDVDPAVYTVTEDEMAESFAAFKNLINK